MNHGRCWMLGVGSLVLVSSELLSGCFFDRLQQSEESDIQRVEQKQAILQTERSSSATLKQQEQMLTAELSERELSLNELNDRVQAINAQNGLALADNQAARVRYGSLLDRLHATDQELVAARQGATDSIGNRRERVVALKARLKAQVDSLFP